MPPPNEATMLSTKLRRNYGTFTTPQRRHGARPGDTYGTFSRSQPLNMGQALKDRQTAANMQDEARLAIIHLWANLAPTSKVGNIYTEGALALGRQIVGENARAVIYATDKVSGEMVNAVEKMVFQNKTKFHADPSHPPFIRHFIAFFNGLYGFAEGIYQELSKKFGREGKFHAKLVKSIVKGLAFGLAERTVASSIKDAMNVVQGLSTTLRNVVRRVSLYMDEKLATNLSGHAASTAAGMKRVMLLGMFEGLTKIIKAGVETGTIIASAACGTLVRMLVNGLETLVKAVWRFFELIELDRWNRWCREAWNGRHQSAAPHRSPEYFASVYGRICKLVPLVPALVLTTGICGSKTAWIDCVSRHSQLIDATTFGQNASYIDSLKATANDVIVNQGVQLKASASVKPYYEAAKRRAHSQENAAMKGLSPQSRGYRFIKALAMYG